MCRLAALFSCHGNGLKVQVCWHKNFGFILLHTFIKKNEMKWHSYFTPSNIVFAHFHSDAVENYNKKYITAGRSKGFSVTSSANRHLISHVYI